eukprot:m.201326 g.201326  ORF g.201326 m.201326 type:complete len:178 (+) comp13715_c0_seq35:821-1354(+)
MCVFRVSKKTVEYSQFQKLNSFLFTVMWEYFTVVNFALGGVAVYLVYKLFGFDRRLPTALEPLDLPLRDFTLEELKKYDGTNVIPEHRNGKAIYIAVDNVVFDMTTGATFYGPGGPYAGFAGRDASRGLATMEIGSGADVWDDCEDLSQEQRNILQDWKEKFSHKYPIRGKLVKTKE